MSEIGLVGQPVDVRLNRIADSSDGLAVIRTVNTPGVDTNPRVTSLPDLFLAAVEIKTLTSRATQLKASNLRTSVPNGRTAPLLILSRADYDRDPGKWLAHYKKYIWTPGYRAQTLHHSVALGVGSTLFIAASSRTGPLYAVLVQFPTEIIEAACLSLELASAEMDYTDCNSVNEIPRDVLEIGRTVAAGMEPFLSTLGLGLHLRAMSIENEAPVRCVRRVRTIGVDLYNHLNNATDKMSVYLASLSLEARNLPTVFRILINGLVMQIVNAFVVSGICSAYQNSELPCPQETEKLDSMTHRDIRRIVNRQGSLADYIMNILDDETNQWGRCVNEIECADGYSRDGSHPHTACITLRNVPNGKDLPKQSYDNFNTFKAPGRGVLVYFNKEVGLKRRLEGCHVIAKVPFQRRCSLCSKTTRDQLTGKVSRAGGRPMTRCTLCDVHLCTKRIRPEISGPRSGMRTCWEIWHSEKQLAP